VGCEGITEDAIIMMTQVRESLEGIDFEFEPNGEEMMEGGDEEEDGVYMQEGEEGEEEDYWVKKNIKILKIKTINL